MGLMDKLRETQAKKRMAFVEEFAKKGEIIAVYGAVGEPGSMYECAVNRKTMKLSLEEIAGTKVYQNYVNEELAHKEQDLKNNENSGFGKLLKKVRGEKEKAQPEENEQ